MCKKLTSRFGQMVICITAMSNVNNYTQWLYAEGVPVCKMGYVSSFKSHYWNGEIQKHNRCLNAGGGT